MLPCFLVSSPVSCCVHAHHRILSTSPFLSRRPSPLRLWLLSSKLNVTSSWPTTISSSLEILQHSTHWHLTFGIHHLLLLFSFLKKIFVFDMKADYQCCVSIRWVAEVLSQAYTCFHPYGCLNSLRTVSTGVVPRQRLIYPADLTSCRNLCLNPWDGSILDGKWVLVPHLPPSLVSPVTPNLNLLCNFPENSELPALSNPG